MADIAAANVTYTITERQALPGVGTRNVVTVVFGDNTLTYPTGGVPLDKQKLGCPNSLSKLVVVDQGANAKGFKFEWDKANNKLLVLIEAAVGTNTPLAQHTNATFVPNPATLIVEAVGY
jgi:hypothetical protein